MLFINPQRLQTIPADAAATFAAQSAALLTAPFKTITDNVADIKQIAGANNYASIAPYWHPDPATTTGFPYIRQDGVRNPEAAQTSDSKYMYGMIGDLHGLAVTYKITGDEVYAERAIAALRVFFIDTATKMNPNLTYSQIVFGADRTDFRFRGYVIDLDKFSIIVDLIEILKDSPSFTEADTLALQNWFSAMADWFATSISDIAESGSTNNIKTSYVTQRVAYLCAANRRAEAIAYLNSAAPSLLDYQIDAEGKQPLELARVTGRQYSEFNLTMWCRLATMANNLGVDLWNHVGENGVGSIKAAMVYMAQFINSSVVWPFSDEPVNPASSREWLRYAAVMYDDPAIVAAYACVRMYGVTMVNHYITTPPGPYIERA